jgi:hypothetical protein
MRGIPLKVDSVEGLMNGASRVAEVGGKRESRIRTKTLRKRRP